MGLSDITTCFYQVIFDEDDINYTRIIPYFIMHGLGLCIKLNSFVTHMFYVWKLSHNKAVPIYIKYNTYFFL